MNIDIFFAIGGRSRQDQKPGFFENCTIYIDIFASLTRFLKSYAGDTRSRQDQKPGFFEKFPLDTDIFASLTRFLNSHAIAGVWDDAS